MNLEILGRRALLLVSNPELLHACRTVLEAEGVSIVVPEAASTADIVVAAAACADVPILDADEEELFADWGVFVDTVDIYQQALPNMLDNRWGRYIWLGPARAKSLDTEGGEMDAAVTLGMLGLHKVISGENAAAGITANAILYSRAVPPEATASAVAFLCSVGAGYLTGVTVTVDGGTGSAMF
jgi:NAD(P)-dependent dehydrogenase (short-subunit alcohol dehydrogenase family)